jgi:hypothetical protein
MNRPLSCGLAAKGQATRHGMQRTQSHLDAVHADRRARAAKENHAIAGEGDWKAGDHTANSGGRHLCVVREECVALWSVFVFFFSDENGSNHHSFSPPLTSFYR